MERKRDGFLDVNQVARRLKVGRHTVYRLINNGYLPASRLGPVNCIRIKESDVKAFEKERDEAEV